MVLDWAAANAEKGKMLKIFRPDSNVSCLDSNVKLEENPFININSRCMSVILDQNARLNAFGFCFLCTIAQSAHLVVYIPVYTCWCAQYTWYKIDVQGTLRQVDNFSSVQFAVFCLVAVDWADCRRFIFVQIGQIEG